MDKNETVSGSHKETPENENVSKDFTIFKITRLKCESALYYIQDYTVLAKSFISQLNVFYHENPTSYFI